MKLPKVVLLVALLLLLPLAGTGKEVSRFDALFVFGDSLSDIGNDYIGSSGLGVVPAIPPSTSPHRTYFNGRFSNGPVAVEYLWWLLSLQPPGSAGALRPSLASPGIPSSGGLSYAFGGSGTGLGTDLGGLVVPGLIAQVGLFAEADRVKAAPRRSLYVVMSGANDYLPTPGSQPSAPADSVANIVAAVISLYATGARHVVVVNLPDLGTVPLVSPDPGLASLMSALSREHNVLLSQALAGLRLPGLTLYPVDINGALSLLPGWMNTAVPALDALVPVAPPAPPTSLCLFIDPASCPDAPTFDTGAAFFYWDAEHPTTAVHAALGWHLFTALR